MNGAQPYKRRSGGAALGVLWGANFACLGLVAFILLVLVPRMAQAFADFGVRPPARAVMVFRISQSPALVLVGLALIAAAQIALARIASGAGRIVLFTSTLLEIVLVVAVASAVLLPYAELLNSVSSGPGSSGG